MAKPTRAQAYAFAVLVFRGLNACMIWAAFVALLFGLMLDWTWPVLDAD